MAAKEAVIFPAGKKKSQSAMKTKSVTFKIITGFTD
jgi:hypothetical protein